MIALNYYFSTPSDFYVQQMCYIFNNNIILINRLFTKISLPLYPDMTKILAAK